MGMESITGYTIINAESLDEAVKIAQDNPFIASIRVYEVRSHWSVARGDEGTKLEVMPCVL